MTLPSTEKYIFYLNSTKNLLEQTIENVRHSESLKKAHSLIKESKRVFFSGSGSSVPAASFACMSILARTKTGAAFLKTSDVLSLKSLGPEDLLILVSQGFNRSDALIIQQVAEKAGAALILITAADVKLEGRSAVIKIVPNSLDERIFSRPCGVITSFAATQMLIDNICEKTFSEQAYFAALSQAAEVYERLISNNLPEKIAEASHIVVLGSGLIKPAVENLALCLREGAAKIAEFYEIEYYGHGQYVPHLSVEQQGKKILYLIVRAKDEIISSRAVDRISQLVKETKLNSVLIEVGGTPEEANVAILRIGGLLVGDLILASGYDMNSPPGKEENRDFHTVPPDYYDNARRL